MDLKQMDAEIDRKNAELDAAREDLRALCRRRDEAVLEAELAAMDPAARERLKKALLK